MKKMRVGIVLAGLLSSLLLLGACSDERERRWQVQMGKSISSRQLHKSLNRYPSLAATMLLWKA